MASIRWRGMAVVTAAATAVALGVVAAPGALGNSEYTYDWDGRGSDSLQCDKVGESPERTDEGWIHWVFSTKGASTDAELTLGGSGAGTFDPGNPLNSNVWHFYTPFFDVGSLSASIELFGGAPGKGGGLVISDYCPGDDEPGGLPIRVSKTANTTYDREHFWDITKKVETENGYTHDDLPKVWLYTDGSGNETATWTVDVTYEGYEDSGWTVSGDITVENFGTESPRDDVSITDIDDLMGGEPIEVTCPGGLPQTLAAGDELVCTYSESVSEAFAETEGQVNEVTVYAERAEPALTGDFYAYADIIWGDPANEKNETVNVEDISDLFGEVDLGSVTAPDDATFDYTEYFAWADYGADECGDYVYDNEATIVETDQSASATLKVNVQCYIWETAFAKGDAGLPPAPATCFIDDGFDRWGWTNFVNSVAGTYSWPLWAGAGQCDTSKGTLAGTVTVTVAGGAVTAVDYDVDDGFLLGTTATYAGALKYPTITQGKRSTRTVAPGQYSITAPAVWVIAHANVGIPDPNFGPLP